MMTIFTGLRGGLTPPRTSHVREHPRRLASIVLLLAALCLAATLEHASASAPISLVRGVLLTGKFRTQAGLNMMSGEDQRNTLITELAGRTKDDVRFYQGLNDADLAGAGALLDYLRATGSRNDAELKTMSADDMRNTVIVEVGIQRHRGRDLQALSNTELIRLVMGPERSYIRGVLLVGKFRRQTELNAMSTEDQRNTLITELSGRTRDSVGFYQGLNDTQLAGTGALLVYLRETGSRTDPQIRTMSADDMRNTVIVEVHAQTRRSDLQALTNMQLALTVLGTRQLPSLDGVPEHMRPGQHVLDFRVTQTSTRITSKSYSDVPFIGTFTGRGTDCRQGFVSSINGSGAGETFTAAVGWGQIEGDGHPDTNSDQCLAWISQLMLDFDVGQFLAIPSKTLDRAELLYTEAQSPTCWALVYTQGGFLVDPMTCWTDGDGNPQDKPGGCLSLQIPDEDWIRNPPQGRPVGRLDFPVQKTGRGSWDITSFFETRFNPGLGAPPTGFGYMLTGDPLDIGNLTADDNTRCTSQVSDIRLRVAYTVPPQQEAYDPVLPN